MTDRFDFFVILAARRTGSNLLEAGINQIDGLNCHGELFNEGFIGWEGREEYLGVDLSARYRRPDRLLDRLLTHDPTQLHGFRLFATHDERIIQRSLKDPRCAKIILRRRPLASYLSTLQAEATGLWREQSKDTRQNVKVQFDPDQFEQYAAETDSWYRLLEEQIRRSGQTFFPIIYEECKDTKILNGIASFLGAPGRLDRVEEVTLRQNPVSLVERIENYSEFSRYLERSGYVELVDRVPESDIYLLNGSRFLAGQSGQSLLFDVPMNAPHSLVSAFLSGDHRAVDGYSALTNWVKSVEAPSVAAYVAHPVERAYIAFNKVIFEDQRINALGIHNHIKEQYDTVLLTASELDGTNYDVDIHRDGFLTFLNFLIANLEERTGIRKRRIWMPQSGFLSAISRVLPGIRPVRQGFLRQDLSAFPEVEMQSDKLEIAEPFPLEDIYNEDVEMLVRQLYVADYRNFGFSNWTEALRRL